MTCIFVTCLLDSTRKSTPTLRVHVSCEQQRSGAADGGMEADRAGLWCGCTANAAMVVSSRRMDEVVDKIMSMNAHPPPICHARSSAKHL
eukprot:m.102565 g.102565  ORF g.102565 m.102565 type:complete len:90 (+) comp16823_c0_seq18:750-1019(+)